MLRLTRTSTKTDNLSLLNLSNLTDEDLGLSAHAKEMFYKRYNKPGETIVEKYRTIAQKYSSNLEHASRMFYYMQKQWFSPATPIWADKGAAPSCYITTVNNDIQSFTNSLSEISLLSAYGGGVAVDCDALRSLPIHNGVTVDHDNPDINAISFHPNYFGRILETLQNVRSGSSIRHGSMVIHIDISHDNILEFLDMRAPNAHGDPLNSAKNIHHMIGITDKFMYAFLNNENWTLKTNGATFARTISARELLFTIIKRRLATGEPYIAFMDNINNQRAWHQKILQNRVRTLNLCTEITLPSDIDIFGQKRTGTCILGSFNAKYWEEFQNSFQVFLDVLEFMDNVLQSFKECSINGLENAIYAAKRANSVGIGLMGLHTLLQRKNIAFDDEQAEQISTQIAQTMQAHLQRATKHLGRLLGVCPDIQYVNQKTGSNLEDRHSHLIAYAPNSSTSLLFDVSAGITPHSTNIGLFKSIDGSHTKINPECSAMLKKYNMDTPAIWQSIMHHDGSVQHLTNISPHDRRVFATFSEIDQFSIIKMAGKRQEYIDQAQSINGCTWNSKISLKQQVRIFLHAWKNGIKSLYYHHSKSVGAANIQMPQTECIGCAN